VKHAGSLPHVEDDVEILCMEQELMHRVRMQPEPGRYFSKPGCARFGYAAATSRIGDRSALPGVQSSTYRTKGFSCEHGNLDPSAGHAKPGKPTSPATSRTRGGASVVVGARESRAHGEGWQ
jgi:hypothetical protein